LQIILVLTMAYHCTARRKKSSMNWGNPAPSTKKRDSTVAVIGSRENRKISVVHHSCSGEAEVNRKVGIAVDEGVEKVSP
jgi:hypothetical protein